MIGFWVISFVYVWTGAHHIFTGPSAGGLKQLQAFFFSLIIPVIAVITNFLGTFASSPKDVRFDGPVPKFLMAGTIYYYLLTCIQGPMQAIPQLDNIFSKNDYIIGHAHMALLGAFSFFALAGVYYVIPKIVGRPLFDKKLGNITFWIMAIATIPFLAPYLFQAIFRAMWLNPENTFVQTLMATKPWHIIRALSIGLIFFAYFYFYITLL